MNDRMTFTYLSVLLSYSLAILTSRKQVVKKSSYQYFKKTILIFLVVAFEILLFMWSGTTQFIGIIIGPVCVILTISGMAKPIFLQIERDNNGEESDDEEAEADLSDYENIDYEKLAKKAEENKK